MVVAAPEAATDIAELAADRVDELEARWSRFRPTSEVSAINQSAGSAVAVSADTVELVTKAIAAWELTEGAFDPTVLPALEASGYDRSFETIDTSMPAPTGCDGQRTPGCAGIVVDLDRGTVLLPENVGFDPGGIGKGLAADLIARRPWRTERPASSSASGATSLPGVSHQRVPAGLSPSTKTPSLQIRSPRWPSPKALLPRA